MLGVTRTYVPAEVPSVDEVLDSSIKEKPYFCVLEFL